MRHSEDKQVFKIVSMKLNRKYKKLLNIKYEPIFYSIDPTNTPVEYYQGIAAYNIRDYNLALRYFEKSNKNNPYHLMTLNNLGTCLEKTGNRKKALDIYRTALDISPRFYDTLLNMSVLHYKMGDLRNALKFLAKCGDDCEDPRYREYFNIYKKEVKRENE